VDDLGIVRVASRDVPWEELPKHAQESVQGATSPGEIIDAILDDERPWPHALQSRLLHPAQGVAATLAPVSPGTSALDLGTGWATLDRALRSLGASVTGADWSLQRLRFRQLMSEPPPQLAVHVAVDQTLPWGSRCFDFAFVDMDEVHRAGGRPTSMMREIRRVLTEDGIAVIGTRSWLSGGPPGLLLRLRQAGFTANRLIVPVPQRHGWRCLVPSTKLHEHMPASRPSTGAKGWILHTIIGRLGAHWLAPDWFVIASCGASKPTLSEHIVGPRDGLTVTLPLSDARVAVKGDDTFVKVPLSEQQQQALVQEVENTRQARKTGFAPYVVTSCLIRHRHGIPYAEYPLIRSRFAMSGEIAQVIEDALREVAPGTAQRLRTTSFWERLTSSRGERDAAEIGAKRLRITVLERCGNALVPVGPTHGDLHAENVLFSETGHPLLVDWNRFELVNPLLLDAGYAAVRGHMAATGASFSRVLVEFASGKLSSSLTKHANTLLGDLTLHEAATLILLDRIMSYSLPRRRHKPWTMGWLQRATQRLETYLTGVDARGPQPNTSGR
jgi:SAM-dependent methyltransferase